MYAQTQDLSQPYAPQPQQPQHFVHQQVPVVTAVPQYYPPNSNISPIPHRQPQQQFNYPTVRLDDTVE
jgi:hypothetical protein